MDRWEEAQEAQGSGGVTAMDPLSVCSISNHLLCLSVVSLQVSFQSKQNILSNAIRYRHWRFYNLFTSQRNYFFFFHLNAICDWKPGRTGTLGFTAKVCWHTTAAPFHEISIDITNRIVTRHLRGLLRRITKKIIGRISGTWCGLATFYRLPHLTHFESIAMNLLKFKL